jgi:hypothetical protein
MALVVLIILLPLSIVCFLKQIQNILCAEVLEKYSQSRALCLIINVKSPEIPAVGVLPVFIFGFCPHPCLH